MSSNTICVTTNIGIRSQTYMKDWLSYDWVPNGPFCSADKAMSSLPQVGLTVSVLDLNAMLQPDIPGPLIISDIAVICCKYHGVWNTTIEIAEYRIQNHATVLLVSFSTTVEERCWVTPMALRREEDLQETTSVGAELKLRGGNYIFL
ncbi:hypothetical protein CY34DRAFT_105851 [Suillus luteus UH-Slu-Lm8-n1]|uniref:Uncharacterized protein n=1 Tax=Suillus luteus UH-Slu-Lm8-n1 TaxID=930992 RepID=A0A0D0A3P3_9AGAM|nr:hypothetical protein CY34DRAFT_105851 [Suillus luteus UH-Slu-Lm8-n1]